MTRARTLISLTLGLLLIAGAGFGYFCVRQQQQADELAAELVATEQLLAPLDKVVTLQFEDGTPLRDWLAEFTRQSGIEVEFATGANEFQQLAGRVPLNAETPLQLRIPPLRAEEFLNLASELYEVPWTLRSSGRVSFNSNSQQEEQIVRQLPTPAGIRPEEQQEFRDLLWEYSTLIVDGRTSVNLNPDIVATRGGIAVVALARRVRLIERFSQRLAAAYQRSRELPPFGAGPADPAFRPLWLEVDEATIDQLAEVFDRPVTLNVVDMPFTDLAANLSQQVKFPVVIHPIAARDFHQNTFATCRLQRQPLKQLLDHLPAQDGLALFPTYNGKLLVVGQRKVADRTQFQMLAAYPVGDLALDERGQDRSAELLLALDRCANTYERSVYPAHHNAKYSYAGGRLLIIEHRYDVHVQIQRVLAALRQARNVRVRNVAIADQYEPLGPNQRVVLQRPLSLQYSDATLEAVAKDQRERGLVPLVPVGESREPFSEPLQFWCYLPERPLGENLQTLCSQFGHQLVEHRDHLLLRWPEQLELDYKGLACEVIDLRPWLINRSEDHWPLAYSVGQLLRHRVRQYREDDRFQVEQFRDLLIARCVPEQLPRIHEILRVLVERANSPEPNTWRGKVIAGESLYEPLTIWPADPAALARDEALQQKLREFASASFQGAKLGDVLLTLANRHQLPIVVRSILPNERRLSGRINYTAADKPLEQILSELIGDPEVISWQLESGCLTVVENYRRKEPKLGYWYSVADLIQPHGPYQLRELENLFAEKSWIAGTNEGDRRISIYATGLLHQYGDESDRQWLDDQLRTLRAEVAAKKEQP